LAAPPDEMRKLTVVKQMFDHLVQLTSYEDEKAGRILASIAFLTVADVTLFASFLGNHVTFRCLSWDLITIAFVGYISSVTVGTIFILTAFGPRFKLPQSWKPVAAGEPKSVFFFQWICKEDEKDWCKYFLSSAPSMVEKKATADLVYECYWIAGKISDKVTWINRRKMLFYLAMLCLVAQAAFGATSIFLGN